MHEMHGMPFFFVSYGVYCGSNSRHGVKELSPTLLLVQMLTLAMQVQKKKIWEAVQPHLKTNEQKQVVYKGTVMTTGAGPVMAPTLANANIS